MSSEVWPRSEEGGDVELAGYDETSDALFDQMQAPLASRPADALRVAKALELRAMQAGDMLGMVRALLVQGTAHNALGHSERDEVFARALTLAEREADAVTLVRAASSQIFVDIYNARYADALWRGQSILGVAHALGRNDLLVRLIINLGTAFSLIGEFKLAISMFHECLALIDGESDPSGQQSQRTINNIAWSWWGLGRALLHDGESAAAADALASAHAFATKACEGALRQPHGELRAGSLDTLVGILVETGAVDEALRWVDRVIAEDADLFVPGSVAWGVLSLARSRAELARPDAVLAPIAERLRAVEALPGPAFRGGELGATLNRCLSDVLTRMGDFAGALARHRLWLQFEARAQSLLAREHAMAVHRTLESLRGETEEFITHDLRNPLGAALVQLAATLDGAMPAQARGRVVEARTHVKRAFDTAERYLVVLRSRHLRRSDLKRIDLAELVDDVGERFAPRAGADVRLERELEWGVNVRCDRIALLMMLQELLRTALSCAAVSSVVRWTLHSCPPSARVTVSGEGEHWAGTMSALVRAQSRGPGEGSIEALMVERVARLHDVRLEWAADEGARFRVVAHFPLEAEARPEPAPQ